MFNKFKNDMIYYKKEAFNQLNEEYRKKKYSSYEEFEKSMNNSMKNIVTMKADKYNIKEYDGYKQYIISDQNENFYIFNETAAMDYTVILDTYTIDIPEFTEQYNKATDADKALLNIQRVFEAINDGDYRYVYNKLDNTFRQTNFPTELDFENYAKQHFYSENSIGYDNYQTSNDLHIYEITIKDKNNSNNQEIVKNFIVKLEEGTDYVMSFEVE